MKKFNIFCLLLILFSVSSLPAQSDKTIDSLKALLDTNSSNITIIYIGIAQQYFQLQNIDSSLFYGQKAIELARESQDSSNLRNALSLVSGYYLALGDSLKADKFSVEHKNLAIAYGLHPEGGEFMGNSYPYYNIPYFELYNSLEILKETSQIYGYPQIKKAPFQKNNTRNNIDTSAVYWMRLKISGSDRPSGPHVISIGNGAYSWKKIDLYYEKEDSLIHQKSGFDLPVSKKAFPDAFNWFEISLKPNEVLWLYVRVEGVHDYYKVDRLHIHYIKPENAPEFIGYRYLGQFISPNTQYSFKHNVIGRNIEVFADTTGTRTMDEVIKSWGKNARFSKYNFFSPEPVYWIKLRLIGNSFFHGEQLFSVGNGNEYNWRKISVYCPDGQGGYNIQKTGNDIPVWKKYRRHWKNLFVIDVPPSDTLEVFIRLEKMSKTFPSKNDIIYFLHIDQTTFWKPHSFASFFSGLFYGALCFSILYFLLLYLMEKDKIHFYFSGFLWGLLIVNLFNTTEEIQPFFHLSEWATWITAFGEIIAVSSLFIYTKRYLNLSEFNFKVTKGIPYFLIAFGIVVLIHSYFFNSYDAPSNVEWYTYFHYFFIILAILYAVLLGILALRKGYHPAVYYLLAFLFCFIGIFILSIGELAGLNTSKFISYYYAFKLGILLTIIFFALGMGYRTKLLRNQKEEAVIAQNKAEAAEAAAREANETKSAFLSTVSHELRTPLTSIIGFTKLNKKSLHDRILPGIKEGETKAHKAASKMDKNLDVVASESQRLTILINDLLDLAKIEAGKVVWNIEEANPKEVIQNAIASTSALFAQKPGLKLIKDLPDELPMIEVDKNRMLQVMINLISNAVKFTDQGFIKIGINSELRTQNAELIFYVQDTGTGIPASQLDQVFDKFKQVDDNQSGKPKGTGLGLPICKEIVEYHGGKIWVESVEDKGSTFYFTTKPQRSTNP